MTDATVADHRSPILQLAIDTTGRCGSIAILEDQTVLETINLPETARTAASLAVHLDQILQKHRDGTQPIQLVSVADGPGSFTGLRIGVTTAKSLCYALKIPLVSVDSLAAIAAAAFHQNPSSMSLCIALDAYRKQVFAGQFRRRELLSTPDQLHPTWTPHPPQVKVLSAQDWQSFVDQISNPESNAPDHKISAAEPTPQNTGFQSSTSPNLPTDRWQAAGDPKPFSETNLPILERQCDAVGVGLLAWRAFRIGKTTDPIALLPRYLKPSAAEEKANA